MARVFFAGARSVSQMSTSRFLRRGVGGGLGAPWTTGARSQAKSGSVVRRGRQLLDQEGLACLLGKCTAVYHLMYVLV